MKKRLFCLLLAAVLLLSLPYSASADTSGVCFTAVGDTLQRLNLMAVSSGGSIYVPSKIFSSLGVYTNYFESDSVALLYNGSKQIFFDMNGGTAYDSLGTTYEVAAIFRGGQIYVPASWVCIYFGLSFSYISGTGDGDIARIKDGSEVLSDSDFLTYANLSMKYYYNEYYGVVTPSTPTPGDSPSDEDEDHSGTYVFLGFCGLPDDKLLDSLSRFSYSAAFFLTQEQAEAEPDTLRRIYGSGHSLGIFCQSSAADCDAAADAVFGACQSMPTLLCSGAELSAEYEEYGQSHAMVPFVPTLRVDGTVSERSSVVQRLEDATGYISLSIELSEATLKMLPSLLSYLSAQSYAVLPLRETSI